MPRQAAQASIEEILNDAIEEIVKCATTAITQILTERITQRLTEELDTGKPQTRTGQTSRKASPQKSRTDVTSWTANRQARRVPNFVIEATGLKTKQQIVARYGDGTVFEKGKALPKAA